MKPFPEVVQKAFPLPGRLPERPWWCCVQHYEGQPRYRRMDDINRPRDSGAGMPLESLVFTIHPTSDHAAKADSQNPIPHPGYRAGQVWAAENGSSVVLMSVTNKSAWICRDLQGITPASLDTLAGLYPYLVADPACPHLAPWSPVEEK